jgi:hypothetical protein
MGSRVISLSDYRENHSAGEHEPRKISCVRPHPKKPSHPRAMKMRRRVVGTHVDSADRVTIESRVYRAKLKTARGKPEITLMLIFLLCLALAAFAL